MLSPKALVSHLGGGGQMWWGLSGGLVPPAPALTPVLVRDFYTLLPLSPILKTSLLEELWAPVS